MPGVKYEWFGGRHAEAASLRGLLAQAGVVNPVSGQPLSEPLCFGIAGGIGAGYSFCPSVLRWGTGSGVSLVGRYFSYATSAAWYQGCFDRLGIKTRITETGSEKKALQNLCDELTSGRPAAVWCGRTLLSFLHDIQIACGLWMHSFVIYEIDETAGIARGSDCAATPVTISLSDLAQARASVCTHKNRTLTIESPKKPLSAATLKAAIFAGIRAGMGEMLAGKMKTFSLPGWETLAKMIANDKSKAGWLKVYPGGLLYFALRDLYDSLETAGTGGGLYRGIYSEFLDEAAALTGKKALADFAAKYRQLAAQWTELGQAMLPGNIKPLRETRQLLLKKRALLETKGAKADKQMGEITAKLRLLGKQTRENFPLSDSASRQLLEGLREQIIDLHRAESDLATKLLAAIA